MISFFSSHTNSLIIVFIWNSVESNIVCGFGIFGGICRVCCLVVEDEPELFGKVRSSVFPDLGLGSAHFSSNRFEVRTFWKGLVGFEVQFW